MDVCRMSLSSLYRIVIECAALGFDLYTTGMSLALLGLLSNVRFFDNHLHGHVLV